MLDVELTIQTLAFQTEFRYISQVGSRNRSSRDGAKSLAFYNWEKTWKLETIGVSYHTTPQCGTGKEMIVTRKETGNMLSTSKDTVVERTGVPSDCKISDDVFRP